MSYHGMCYMVLYYIRYYACLMQDSLHHVILPKINYKIKRHAVLCHSKNTACYHHVSLHSVLCPWVARNTTFYKYHMLYVLYCLPYILSCVLKYMGFYHTWSYYSALCQLILLNRIIPICILLSYQSLLFYIILCQCIAPSFYVYTEAFSIQFYQFSSFSSQLLQCVDFRTNCDYLIANCNSPMLCHKPQPEIAILQDLLKKHLLRALEMAIRCFLTSSTQWGRCENVGRG